MASVYSMLAVAMLLCLSTFTSFVFAAPLDKAPHLRCSACQAVADLVGKKMNETAKQRSTFQASHRLDAQNKIKRVDYEKSELRAVEILDKICDTLAEDYSLRYSPETKRRLYSNNKTLKHADLYGKSDKKRLGAHKKRLREVCFDITEEHDEEVMEMIKNIQTLEELENQLCFVTMKMCTVSQEKENESLEVERTARKAWLKVQRAREKKEAERIKMEDEKREREKEQKKADEAEKKRLEELENPPVVGADPAGVADGVPPPMDVEVPAPPVVPEEAPVPPPMEEPAAVEPVAPDAAEAAAEL